MNIRQLVSSISGRWVLTFCLLAAFAFSLLQIKWENPVHPGGGSALGEILNGFFHPDMSSKVLKQGLAAAWRTMAYSVAGMHLALLIGIPLGIVASGTLSNGSRFGNAVTIGARAMSGFLRAIHELVWAWLFVVALGLSPFVAVLALGLSYGGILARNFSEQLNDVVERPLQSLRSSGATEWKVLVYGRLPMAIPGMISYGLYRWECAIRSAAIMSFIGLGGLGYRVRIALDDLYYDQVWTYLFILIGLVIVVDVWSSFIRKRLAL